MQLFEAEYGPGPLGLDFTAEKVTAVVAGGQCALAGVMPGDTIISVGRGTARLAAAGMSHARIGAMLQSATRPLTVVFAHPAPLEAPPRAPVMLQPLVVPPEDQARSRSQSTAEKVGATGCGCTLIFSVGLAMALIVCMEEMKGPCTDDKSRGGVHEWWVHATCFCKTLSLTLY
jgi:hypothetical protein